MTQNLVYALARTYRMQKSYRQYTKEEDSRNGVVRARKTLALGVAPPFYFEM